MLKKLFLFLALIYSLIGCNFVESINEMNAQSEFVTTRLERDLGVKPLIAWNINNNTLTNVNVIFESKDVGSRSYNELEPVIRKAVEDGFKRKPSKLMISVQSSGK